jgi:hypothetical protein
MKFRSVALLLLLAIGTRAPAQDVVHLRSAAVVLSDDAVLREEFRRGVVSRAVANDYDMSASYTFAPREFAVRKQAFLDDLAAKGIQTVLILRPLSIGPGTSLESVRNDVAPDVYDRMREFAAEAGKSIDDDLVAIVHLAIYIIVDDGPHLISSGAVWLDESVESQDMAVERLLDLVLSNVNAVRPGIRDHLGLPPLP